MTVSLPDDQYKKQLDKWQGKLREAQCNLYNRRKSLVYHLRGPGRLGEGREHQQTDPSLEPPNLPGSAHRGPR